MPQTHKVKFYWGRITTKSECFHWKRDFILTMILVSFKVNCPVSLDLIQKAGGFYGLGASSKSLFKMYFIKNVFYNLLNYFLSFLLAYQP